jgi:hypothetical protein
VALGLLIFVLGGVCGGGLSILYVRHRVLYAIHHPQEVPARLSRDMQRWLGLSAEETEKVRQIIARRQLALQALRRDVQPKVEGELEELRKEIASALKPEQAAKWNAWYEHVRRTWVPPPPASP